MVIFHSRLLNYQRVSQNIPTTSTVESILIICSGLEGTQFLVSSMIRWCPPDVNVGEHKPHENYGYISRIFIIVIGVICTNLAFKNWGTTLCVLHNPWTCCCSFHFLEGVYDLAMLAVLIRSSQVLQHIFPLN